MRSTFWSTTSQDSPKVPPLCSVRGFRHLIGVGFWWVVGSFVCEFYWSCDVRAPNYQPNHKQSLPSPSPRFPTHHQKLSGMHAFTSQRASACWFAAALGSPTIWRIGWEWVGEGEGGMRMLRERPAHTYIRPPSHQTPPNPCIHTNTQINSPNLPTPLGQRRGRSSVGFGSGVGKGVWVCVWRGKGQSYDIAETVIHAETDTQTHPPTHPPSRSS